MYIQGGNQILGDLIRKASDMKKIETKNTSWKKKNVMKIQNIQEEEKYSKNNNNSMFSEKLDSYFNSPIKSELEGIKKNLFCRK